MRILVTEDDLATRKMLRFVLEQQAGHSVAEAELAEAALSALAIHPFDLLIADLTLPVIDGFELIERVRQRWSIPILTISGRGEVAERVRALRIGADDFLAKPFDPAELVARVDALLRRARQTVKSDATGLIQAGRLSIDLTRQCAQVDNSRTVRLTPTEVRLLLRLAHPPGEVRTRAELAQALWGPEPSASGSAINTYIADLRRKLEPGAPRPRLLQTVRGLGYRLSP